MRPEEAQKLFAEDPNTITSEIASTWLDYKCPPGCGGEDDTCVLSKLCDEVIAMPVEVFMRLWEGPAIHTDGKWEITKQDD